MRVADYIAQFIYEHGATHVFMLSGGGIMHLTDGLVCNKNLKAFCLHHEQSVSMALEGYAKVTEKLGVGYFTTGPGATNAITGLASAWLDSIPCLFISGQVKVKDTTYNANIPGIRQIGAQEMNILPIVTSITKYSAFVDKPEDIKYHLQKALYFSQQGRPGPVWLDIPLDVQGAHIKPKNLKGFTPPKKEASILNVDIEKVAQYLTSAKRPVILAGQGVKLSGAVDALLTFATKHQIPIVTTYLGIDIIEYNHPCHTGLVGIKGTRAGNLAVQNSDVLLVIGSSLPVVNVNFEYHQFAREAKVVIIDTDLSSHKKKTIKIDSLIKGDAKEFIKKLSDFLHKEKMLSAHESWLKTCVSWKKKYPVCLPEYKKLKNKINSYYFIDKLAQKLKSKDVVVTDSGTIYYVGAQAMKIKKGVKYITAAGVASMGYSLPASIGISAGMGNKRVMCITGDGSFQFNIQELQTVVHHKLPLKMFVINNKGYLSLKITQGKFFNSRFIGTGPKSGVSFPDLKKVAKAYGIKFIRIHNNAQLDKGLDQVLNYKGPIICEIMCPDNQATIPSVASEKKPDGTMVSKPMEDMYPFLDREEFKKNMFIKPIEN